MTPYVLDTDTLTHYERGHPTVLGHVQSHWPDVAITVITVEEQWLGWYTKIHQAKRPDDLARASESFAKAVQALAGFQVLPFTRNAITQFDTLRSQKLSIGSKDLRIASIVLALNATLVTSNKIDFQQVPGLVFVDWTV